MWMIVCSGNACWKVGRFQTVGSPSRQIYHNAKGTRDRSEITMVSTHFYNIWLEHDGSQSANQDVVCLQSFSEQALSG